MPLAPPPSRRRSLLHTPPHLRPPDAGISPSPAAAQFAPAILHHRQPAAAQFAPPRPESHPWRHKRMKVTDEKATTSFPWGDTNTESMYKRARSLPDVIDYADPLAFSKLIEELDRGMYGSVNKDIEELNVQTFELLNHLSALFPSISISRPDFSSISGMHTYAMPNSQSKEESHLTDMRTSHCASRDFLHLANDHVISASPALEDFKLGWMTSLEEMQGYGCKNGFSVNSYHGSIGYSKVPDVENDLQTPNNRQIVLLDSDDEESKGQHGATGALGYNLEALNLDVPLASQMGGPYHDNGNMIADPFWGSVLDANRKASSQYQEVVLKKPRIESTIKSIKGIDSQESNTVTKEQKNAETELQKDKGVYVGVQDDLMSRSRSDQRDPDDGLGDIWRQMTLALECSKDATGVVAESSTEEDCDHSFLLKDDLGYVCRVCGVITKSIETIFDFQWGKGSKTTRTRASESQGVKEREENDVASVSGDDDDIHDLAVLDVHIHPRHRELMKTHQTDGFKFLVKNLISDDPAGCILAHAPGSGKTFMIISFIHSFLLKYPKARLLVVLPKGILGTWKKEFLTWQIEDTPLYDFYSKKADSRKDQLSILKQWVDHRSILFLGYKQFANIICKCEEDDPDAVACKNILLKKPSILIMDEGHTPRNDETDNNISIREVRTPRKVVLSGTIFQNHVREVFNIVNLVHPQFKNLEKSRTIRRRIMSKVEIRRKNKVDGDSAFYEAVEWTLRHDDNTKRKMDVIQDLREMTENVLHYYKGDFLDQLPGLVDFTVYLNLTPKQKSAVDKLKHMERFRRASVATAVYVHPLLREFSDTADVAEKSCNISEAKMDELITRVNIRDGVKAKFFLNILGLCESSGEKLLVFSQYLLPLKFLEKLVVNDRGWSHGKEIFTILGDTSPEERELYMEQFNNSDGAKVFFGSIKACGEGISLVGASRIIIMDVHLNPSVTRQAIGRSYRPGQHRKLYVYRLVASDTNEEENHTISFEKELMSKSWFEGNEVYGNSKTEMETIDVKDSDDQYWGSLSLREDVNVVKIR